MTRVRQTSIALLAPSAIVGSGIRSILVAQSAAQIPCEVPEPAVLLAEALPYFRGGRWPNNLCGLAKPFRNHRDTRGVSAANLLKFNGRE